jgi:hypothetical protein
MRGARPHSTRVALAAILATTGVSLSPPTATVVAGISGPGNDAAEAADVLSQPHLLQGEVAAVIVRVRGSSVCSGTPMSGTRVVITAAHCVLDRDGDVTSVTVVRDGVEHVPRAVLVNPQYHDAPSPQLDAAALIMDQAIPGAAATLGDGLPTHGLVTIAGLQSIDTDGTLLRGTRYDNRPTPKGVTGGVIKIEALPTGCVHRASSLEIATDHLKVGCGLIPGASGGGLFAERECRLVLLGIISTVSFDLSYNRLTPLAAVHELLSNAGEYTHALPDDSFLARRAPITRQ